MKRLFLVLLILGLAVHVSYAKATSIDETLESTATIDTLLSEPITEILIDTNNVVSADTVDDAPEPVITIDSLLDENTTEIVLNEQNEVSQKSYIIQTNHDNAVDTADDTNKITTTDPDESFERHLEVEEVDMQTPTQPKPLVDTIQIEPQPLPETKPDNEAKTQDTQNISNLNQTVDEPTTVYGDSTITTPEPTDTLNPNDDIVLGNPVEPVASEDGKDVSQGDVDVFDSPGLVDADETVESDTLDMITDEPVLLEDIEPETDPEDQLPDAVTDNPQPAEFVGSLSDLPTVPVKTTPEVLVQQDAEHWCEISQSALRLGRPDRTSVTVQLSGATQDMNLAIGGTPAGVTMLFFDNLLTTYPKINTKTSTDILIATTKGAQLGDFMVPIIYTQNSNESSVICQLHIIQNE